MANARSGNTWYVDTQGETLPSDAATVNARVAYVVVTPTNNNPEFIITDAITTAVKFHAKSSGSSDTVVYNFAEVPLYFPNGINIDTVDKCVVMLVMHPGGQN